jgi:hypothetical protein
MFVFDCETTTDKSQRLTFGSYQVWAAGALHEEGLFYADDLPRRARRVLERYVERKRRAARHDAVPLRLITLDEFRDRLYLAAYKARAMVVGFNLPFDLSRIAHGVTNARGKFEGGFSFSLWEYIDSAGSRRPHKYRPRIRLKHIDSKRALIRLGSRREPDPSDQVPEGSTTGAPEPGYVFEGHFLDLKTLAFALTNQSHSLKSACEAFGVEHGKQSAARHGIVADDYIDYNRRDVQATAELAVKLIEEFDRHPIALAPMHTYSPASIGKAYLRAMGIAPVLERQPAFPPEFLGAAQTAFFGGRTFAGFRCRSCIRTSCQCIRPSTR